MSENRHNAFAEGYEEMCHSWKITYTGASVSSLYNQSKAEIETPLSETNEAYNLGAIVALFHLNGMDL